MYRAILETRGILNFAQDERNRCVPYWSDLLCGAKTKTEPRTPRTSCGGNSSRPDRSRRRSRTASVMSIGFATVLVRLATAARVYGNWQYRELEPLWRADAADDCRAGMNSNADSQGLATSSDQVAIERVHGEQDFLAGGHRILGMLRLRIACAKNCHEPVSQIFVDHPAMRFFDNADGNAKEIIQDLDHLCGRRCAGPRRCRADVHKHDGYLFFHAAQAWITRKNLLSGTLPHMQAEGLAQFFLVL